MINTSLKYLRIGVKYLSFAAINLYDVIMILEGLGYKNTAKLPPPAFRRSLGGRGPIAVKDGVIVDVDTDKHILGVSAPDPDLLISEFNTIEEALTTRLRGYSRPQFYEAMAEYEVSAEAIDFYSLFEKISNLPPVLAVSDTLNINAKLIGLRIGLKGARPEEDEWMDIEIMPSLLKTDNTLYISILHRSKKKEKILTTIKKASNIATAIANSLIKT